ncbi:alkylhydroperoxidase AhpD family core domain-containing protein [Paramicrobacterium humi]|uniref:Alkylhydroperoxidase AhpD family core domain-containing protein n=1 Tax=Paramicrobacterium humi TaxID=640635 RepID=A0A1H4P8P5_9MICO|nr:carboxymuconolactone decarboxylase family protein [Microbacterium humi]SEC03800.1 alkylhydroperoxidase AhpD family core domain-containing protein [Microbacterium humi]
MTPSSRIHPSRTQREAYEALKQVSLTTGKIAADAGLEPRLLELVQLRASQINGCAFCLDYHHDRAIAAGETEQRITVLSAWREARLYSPREQAALALAESVTLIHDGQLPDDVYESAIEVFAPEAYTALLWVLVSINAFNRIAIAGRYPVEARES